MMRKFLSWPIWTQLVFLVFLLAIPTLSMIVWSGVLIQDENVEQAKRDCLLFVNRVAGEQRAVAAGAQQLMTALSLLPDVRSRNRDAVNGILADLLKKNPQYSNLAVTDPLGLVWASATPYKGEVSLADRRNFQEAVRTGMFSSGEYIAARLVKKSALNFAYPVTNASNELISVIVIALDLDYTRASFQYLNLPPGSSFSLLDYRGIILFRHLQDDLSEKLSGSHDIREEIFSKMTGSAEEGTFEAVGNDGKFRIWAYRRISLPHEPKPYLYIRSSIPRAEITSKGYGAMFGILVALLSVFAAGLLLAWFIGRRAIVIPVNRLKEASQKLAAGAGVVNVSSVVKGGELGELALAFDGMADAQVQSQKRLSDIIEFLPDATLVLDRDGKVIAWNRAIEAMTGVKAEEMLGRGNQEYAIPFYGEKRPILIDLALHPDPEMEKHYTTVRRSGDRVFGESFVPNLHSGPAHLSATASVLRDASGEVIAAIECIRDNTDRKRMYDELRRSEKKYRDLVELAQDGIWVMDMKGITTFVNSRMAEMLGYKTNEILGRSFFVFVDKALRPEAIAKIVARQQGIHKAGDFVLKRKDGTDLHVSVSTTPIHDGNGNLSGGFGVLRDLTEREKAEDAIRESEARFRLLVESAPDGVYVQTQGRFAYLNNTALRLFGAESQDQLLGQPFLDRVHPDFRRTVKERARLVVLDKISVPTQEQIYLTMGGIPVDVEVSVVPVVYEGRDGVLVFLRDITSRKRVEEERKALQERLQRSEKMEALGLLAGGMAHDLNNVMGILVGYSELLLDDIDKSSPLRSHVEYIKQGGERASAIIQDLLTLARRGVQTREIVNLSDLIEEFRRSPEFEKICSYHPRVGVEAVLEPGLLNIKGSPIHLRKTIMNLVSNAAEAMPSGGQLTLRAANQYMDRPIPGYDHIQEGDYVVLSVSDTGEGISASDMKRIFEPFYTKKVMGRSGTGLGLAVVWGTVKDHNGYVNVQSEEEKGTTFTLYFPVTREEISREDKAVPVSVYLGDGESILVVDDIRGQRDLAAQMLKKLKYKVVSVASGEEAAEHMKQHKVDLLVLDMIMDPGMDGLDTYREILALHPKQKAIIVSGFSESDRVKQAQALGAGSYVRKPYVSETLGLAVRKELDRPA
jgi:PAS domain S-box-containing protein